MKALPLFKGLPVAVCGCCGCHRLFASVVDFQNHRVGEHGTGLRNSRGGITVIDPGTRRCLTADDLRDRGYNLISFRLPAVTLKHVAQRKWPLPEPGYWSTGQSSEEVNKKRARRKARAEKINAARTAKATTSTAVAE